VPFSDLKVDDKDKESILSHQMICPTYNQHLALFRITVQQEGSVVSPASGIAPPKNVVILSSSVRY